MRRFLLTFATFVVVLCAALAVTFYRDPLAYFDDLVRFNMWKQHVQSRYVQVDGYKLHYLEARPPHGQAGVPLVLIHGLGGKSEDWSPMIPRLAAAGFHVYAPDLLGYGRSPHPDVDYSIALQVKIVTDFMAAENLAHADVGGWSMGGWVALKLAADQPALVDRLVALDAAGIYFPANFDASLFTPGDAAGVYRLLNRLTPTPMPLKPFIERAVVRRLNKNAWILDRSVDSMIGGRDLLDFKIQRITKPVLFVWGKQDALIPLAVGETMHRAVPGSSLLVVDDCGHLAPAECSTPIVKATARFLQADPALEPYEREVPKQ